MPPFPSFIHSYFHLFSFPAVWTQGSNSISVDNSFLKGQQEGQVGDSKSWVKMTKKGLLLDSSVCNNNRGLIFLFAGREKHRALKRLKLDKENNCSMVSSRSVFSVRNDEQTVVYWILLWDAITYVICTLSVWRWMSWVCLCLSLCGLLTEEKGRISVVEYQIVITFSHKSRGWKALLLSLATQFRLYMSTPVWGRSDLLWNRSLPLTYSQRWLACCLVGLLIRYRLHLKGTVHPKIKYTYFPLTCSAIYQSE